MIGHFLGLLFVLAPAEQAQKPDDAEAKWAIFENRLQKLRDKYKVEILATKVSVKLTGTTCSPSDFDSYTAYLQLLEQELACYPADFLKDIGCKRLVLCGSIECYGMRYGGYTERLAGIVAFDVTRKEPANPDSLLHAKLTIHHEIFHILDDHLCFDLKRRAYSDPAWKALNPKGFLYCNFGGPKPDRMGLDKSSPGFLTGYSRFSISEDKAEIFAWKIVRPDVVDDRLRGDEILRHKSRRTEEMTEQVSQGMDKLFWTEMQKKRKPPP